MAKSKHEACGLRLWAVVKEEGFLEDVIAMFTDEASAEYWRVMEQKALKGAICVVPILACIELVPDGDSPGEGRNNGPA